MHEKVTHSIVPSRRDEYLDAAEAYFRALVERSGELGGVKLTGSWETVVGSVGQFTHILEFEGHRGYDQTFRALRADEVCDASSLPHFRGLSERADRVARS